MESLLPLRGGYELSLKGKCRCCFCSSPIGSAGMGCFRFPICLLSFDVNLYLFSWELKGVRWACWYWNVGGVCRFDRRRYSTQEVAVNGLFILLEAFAVFCPVFLGYRRPTLGRDFPFRRRWPHFPLPGHRKGVSPGWPGLLLDSQTYSKMKTRSPEFIIPPRKAFDLKNSLSLSHSLYSPCLFQKGRRGGTTDVN